RRLPVAWPRLGRAQPPRSLTRAAEKAGEVNDLSAAIERMAQGPQLAALWGFDPKLALAVAAWIDMRTRLASFNAVASAPWSEVSRRFTETMTQAKAAGSETPDWRAVFAKWAEISNEELIKNQRTDAFLKSQKELLQ